jgi:hypothetical protein
MTASGGQHGITARLPLISGLLLLLHLLEKHIRLVKALNQGEEMGIFDFFRSKKKELPEVTVATGLMPTVKADPELFKCYDEVFWQTIPDVSGISKTEAAEIHEVITRCDGGFLNQGGYFSMVWERFFKDRTWRWKEYEDWFTIFSKLGRYPSRFPIRKGDSTEPFSAVLEKLKVAELKSLCVEHRLTVGSKAKKTDLINALKDCPGVSETKLVCFKMDDLSERFSYSLYSLLMRTMAHRAKSLHDQRRRTALGLHEVEVIHVFDEDREFVELALKLNPNALHPLFPGDMSITKVTLPF